MAKSLLFSVLASSALASLAAASNHTVLILGGGVAGVIAARSLQRAGINDFVIVEARAELGGRLQSFTFGGKGGESVVLELGANWVQGTEDGGNVNPIFTLVTEHGVKTEVNDWDDISTFDHNGPTNYTDTFFASEDAFAALTVLAGQRVANGQVDLTGRSGYSLTGNKPRTPQEMASEYYQFDWEQAQTPEQSSWIATSWAANFTYDVPSGGFGGDNLLAIDQRGFKHFIQAEAATFLTPAQTRFNATVVKISYSSAGVTVHLKDGSTMTAQHALNTFSVGVLQNADVTFSPALPDWKQEAIDAMVMATYTKIFLQFPHKFWPDTEMGLFADPSERGRYPVWQSLDHPGFFPGSGIFFVTVTGDFSQRIETMTDSAVQAEVMQVLTQMFPNITIPAPLAFHFPRWFSDPLFRGSYSNWPPSFRAQHQDDLRARVGPLWFAGEATSFKHFGFLQGAYFEGVAAGTALADCVLHGQCAYIPSTPVKACAGELTLPSAQS